MRSLSKFQKACEGSLKHRLDAIGRTLVEREIEGDSENYIHAHIARAGIEIWIYEDEALFRGVGVDERFESPDFKSPDALAQAFVDALIDRLEERG